MDIRRQRLLCIRDRFSTDYNASLAAAGDSTSPRLYSWDSTGTSVITTKTGATPITRPELSGPSILTLNANTSSTVDFARSTRGPATTDPSSDVFVAMAKDAVSWASPAGGNAPTNLTKAQLLGIYNCEVTNWRQIDPSLPDATIVPVLAGHLLVDPSGVAGAAMDSSAYFLAAIGYLPWPYYGGLTDRSCVRVVQRGDQGTDPVLHDPNAVVPYSVGRYVGQVYNGHTRPGEDAGVLTVRAINGIAAVNQTSKQINAPFAASSFAHILYNTVREQEWNTPDAHGSALRNIFSVHGWICRSASGLIRSYGFLALPSAMCGSTTHS
ncbi:substrate-binding domain-containing protein [Kitasatospora purpeofusca]|uniref:substrate-binding domain-containing protein n=1 Tax=Kitasatospora purpeofusca TaxID=67352 RepID=UPI0036962EBA